LNDDEVNLVKTHILSSLQRASSISLIRALTGIGSYLKIDEINMFINPLVRVIAKDLGKKHAVFAERALIREFNNIPSKFEDSYCKRINTWINFYEGKDSPEKLIQTLKDIMVEFVPF
jgi:hypothetical protein